MNVDALLALSAMACLFLHEMNEQIATAMIMITIKTTVDTTMSWPVTGPIISLLSHFSFLFITSPSQFFFSDTVLFE